MSSTPPIPREARAPDSPEVLARIQEGLPLVDTLAHVVRRQTSRAVPYDELVAYGREGLVSAARSFDPTRGVPFRCWAGLRVRGAMFDGLRQMGSLPRRVYRAVRALQAAEAVHATLVEERGSSPPASAEDADARLSESLASMATAMAASLACSPPPVEEPDTPEDAVSRAEMLVKIRAAIVELPDSEKHLVERHYFGDITIDEAAREIGLSKSWGSRLHARAIENLTRSLKRSGALPGSR